MRIVQLPVKNQSGNYEIRLESIGGLGANLCGKMLGELGIKYLGLNSASFSSYGSEKTGTPVKAFIRYCEQGVDIRVHSPVTHPHLLGIFHEALTADFSVFEGCTRDTAVVVNTELTAGETEKRWNCPAGKIYLLSAQKIAMETHSRINVVMLGAMAKAMGFVELEELNRICKDTLGKKYPDALSSNLEGIKRGYQEVVLAKCMENGTGASGVKNGRDTGKESGRPKSSGDKTPVWGYETAPAGGINPHFGNSVISDLSPSRQGYIPIFLQDRCINCALCDSTCPDMVFQFQMGMYQGKKMMVNRGLDYYHCKGCLRCVEVCPTQALVKGLESEHPDKMWFIPNQDLLRSPDYYEKTGPDGYITSESYLTEKQVEGGEASWKNR